MSGIEQLVQKFDPQSRLLRTWDLTGGISAQMTAVEIARADGRTRKLVVRRHGAADLQANPHIAADEYRLLRMLRSAGLAVPAPCYLDQSGEIFSTPAIVFEYIEGEPLFAPPDMSDCIAQLATQLLTIHRIDCAQLDVSFLPRQAGVYADKLRVRPAILDESLDEGRIRDALEAVWPLSQRNPSVLLHGDYWPGNVLWNDGELVAVIDWEDAARGDPLADLGNSRLEILWAFGIDAMHRFTERYLSMTAIDIAHLPYWDLCAALRPASKLAEWAADDAEEQRMRAGHRVFTARAFARLSAR